MRVVLGTDNLKGVEVKDKLIKKGYTVDPILPVGPYPEVARRLCERLVGFGVLICRSGIGMAIVANKFPEVRAVNGTSDAVVKRSRQRNDCNVLCLGSDYIKVQNMVKMIEIFLCTDYQGESDQNLEVIKEIERRNFKWSKVIR